MVYVSVLLSGRKKEKNSRRDAEIFGVREERRFRVVSTQSSIKSISLVKTSQKTGNQAVK